jgi:hypothetical protein
LPTCAVTVPSIVSLTIQILTQKEREEETDAMSVTTIFLDNIFHRPKRGTCVGFSMKSLSDPDIKYKRKHALYIYITN